ncbi:MAG: hypothetical protein N4A71_08115 [Carboxylicivirga sp.]|jgi:hypothetical protein|nr:hypothetical protein [Carboxylicivirga sp.]
MVNIKELRYAVEEKFGEKVTTAKQCRILEEAILDETKRRISSATLRRFFGLLPSSSKLSPYNSDTLCIYCQFDIHKEHVINIETLWKDIQKEANSYTKYCLNSIKKKSLSDYSKSIHRLTVEEKLNEFLDSEQIFTVITAPGGYGKSTLLGKWSESTSVDNSDILLFTNALVFENTFQNNGQHSNFIDFSKNSSNSIQLLNEHKLAEGKFIIMVDGIDELSINIEKLKRFILWFIDFMANYEAYKWLKVIFSVRDITYQRYIQPLFQEHLSIKSSESQLALQNQINVPLLSQAEVIDVLQKLDSSSTFDAIWCQITNPEIISLLQTPINSAIYKSNNFADKKGSEETVHNLYKQLVDKYIYHSFCAEEKIDIIEALLEALITKNNNFSIPKNLIKKHYPIHLKQNGNYHLAYNELLSDGVLYEFIEKTYGHIPTYHIGFKHVNFYYYLCAYYFIKINNGLDTELLDNLDEEYENLEFKINVFEHLFYIAYESENLENVCHFFTLSDDIFSTINLSIVIGNCLRKHSSFQQTVINTLVSIPKAQKFLFELFVDVNNLVIGFNNQLITYSKYKYDNEARLFTTSLHLYYSLLTLNKKEALKHYSNLEKLDFNENTFPWPVGRKTAYSILYSSICEKVKRNITLDELLRVREIAYANYHIGYQKEFLFDVSIVYALMLTCNYKLAIDYGNTVIDIVENLNHPDDFFYYAESFHYDVINSLLVYAKFKTGHKLNPEDLSKLSSFAVSNASHYSSYQYIVLINLYASELFLQRGDEQQAKDYFNMAIRLSKYCKYDLLTAYIYFKNPFGNEKLEQQGKLMFENCGFILGDLQ